MSISVKVEDNSQQPLPPPRQQAHSALQAARGLLDDAIAHIKRCSQSAADAVNDHQWACYDLALSWSECTAANFLLAHAAKLSDDDFSCRLATLFCADAVTNTLNRLRTHAADFGLDLNDFHVVDANPQVLAFLRQQLAAHNLAAIGSTVIERDGNLGADLLGEHHSMMRDTFRRFSDEVVAPLAEDVHRKDLIIPDDILEPLKAMGVFGLSIPASYGGLQEEDKEDTLGMIVVTEELSRGSLGAAGSLITRPEILSRALLKGGTERQKQLWLPQIAAGDPLCAVAVTEPNYGSDVAGVQLRATATKGGWLLNGAKTWCTFGGKAGVLLVLARTQADQTLAHRGLSMFLVEKTSSDAHEFEEVQASGGKLTGRSIATIGYRGMHSFQLFFDDFFVPDSHMLGEQKGEGKGFYYAMAGFAGGRIQTAARAVGVMRAAFSKSLSYATERVVFNQPIANYQLTKVKLARMAALILACRQITYDVALLMDSGEGDMEASAAKLFAGRAAEWLTREALQIHGGMGYAEETPVSRYFADARVLSIFEGAEETLALKVIARALIEQAV
ncbi:MAG: acyl-CoA dehydrogenase family protein [Halioglobus sp.]|nr:acyl-CoA dehydrogenase family protein [Halioglobus sp.]